VQDRDRRLTRPTGRPKPKRRSAANTRGLLIGAHVPTTGGVQNAPRNGRAIGADAIQVFTRNQMQWAAKPLSDAETHAFKHALGKSGIREVLAHGSYLVNLASRDPTILARSRDAFLAELRRCAALGIRYMVFHPGAHLGAGEGAGLRAVARGVDEALEQLEDAAVTPLIESTAGQGSCIGHRFEHLAAIFDSLKRPERVGVCLDTCHLFAAGYDLATPAGYAETFLSFERLVGFSKLKAVHVNDSKRALGSRVDRHESPGLGFLGRRTFRRLLRDPRFRGIPMVVETPGPLPAWRREIALLRALAS
jgi:deoxyribonuclease-4